MGAGMRALEKKANRVSADETARMNRILGASVSQIRNIADEINAEGARIRRDQGIAAVRTQVAAAQASGAHIDPALLAQSNLLASGEAQSMLAAAARSGAHISQKAIDALVARSTPMARGVRNFRGGRALVGEEGPELVDLPRGSNVTPNNQMGGSPRSISTSTARSTAWTTSTRKLIKRGWPGSGRGTGRWHARTRLGMQ